MAYFEAHEFNCGCGNCGLGLDNMQPLLIRMLVSARKFAGVPFVLNRAVSCVEHNTKIGGSKTSSHLTGYAVDIDCNDSVTRFAILNGLLKAGFTRIGIYNRKGKTFIHADCDPSKPSCVIW